MMRAALMTWLAASAGGALQDTPTGVLMVGVSAHLYRTDGGRSATAGGSAHDAVDGYVSSPSGFCGLTASRTPPAELPAVGWRYSGRVVDRMADALTVKIDWERLPDLSTAAGDTLPSGSTTATLRPGDQLELDRAVPSGQVSCQTVIVKLEATVAARSPSTGPSGGGRGPTGVGSGPTGVGSGGGRGLSGAGGASAGALGGAGRASGGGVARGNSAGVGAASNAGPAYDAELWLVHRPPGAVEETRHQIVRVGTDSAFAFPSVPIATAQGAVTVEVSGGLRVSSTGGPARLHVSMTRRIAVNGQPDRTGSSSRLLPLPSPSEVISFELPPPPPSAMGDALAGHQFSVRLRLSPK